MNKKERKYLEEIYKDCVNLEKTIKIVPGSDLSKIEKDLSQLPELVKVDLDDFKSKN